MHRNERAARRGRDRRRQRRLREIDARLGTPLRPGRRPLDEGDDHPGTDHHADDRHGVELGDGGDGGSGHQEEAL